MRRKIQTDKKKNKGFSLITVIIAVSFIGILGLLVLYMALSNFYMKAVGLKSKDSFYTAERALEEIRTGLQEDLGDSMSKAYISVLETYNKDSDTTDEVLDELRQKEFEKQFVVNLARSLVPDGETVPADGTFTGTYNMEHLKGYLDLNNSDKYDDTRETLIVTNPSDKTAVLKSDTKDGVLLKNLKVIYVDPQGRASIIETDIRLGIPKVQFPTPSTLPDLMNMIVVADSGIIAEGEANKATTITGSIYAGLLKDEDQPAGSTRTGIYVKSNGTLDITFGDKVVTEGEVNVQPTASFSTAAGVNLWAQGVRLSSAKVSLLGTTYLSDDLTVEKGSGSSVKLQGEYYGYGSPATARSENCWNSKEGVYKDWSDTALSSSIVINGKSTTMDLSGVQKLMLAGKSYIGSSTVKTKATDSYKNTTDVMMGESLTVKGTQIAYILPSELLNVDSGEARNPMTYDEYSKSGLMAKADTDLVKWDTAEELWNGKTLREIGVDAQKPVQAVFYNDNSATGYVYFYLNFSDDASAASFMQEYYTKNQNVKANMDKYLSFYFGGDSGIELKDAGSYLRYVTNGNVLTYDGEKKSGNLNAATDTDADEKLKQEQVNYQNSWYALNRKMITSVDLLKTEVKDEDGIAHDETKSDRSVFDNLVNESAMVKFLEGKSDMKYEFTPDASDEDQLTAIMYHNGKSSTVQEKDAAGTVTERQVAGKDQTLVITQDMADKLRLVVCTGDVEIQGNVDFRGIIMTKGKITLLPGAKLESAPLEAAKVFQKIITEQGESVSPKDFFWEGDKYVLGNTTTTDDETDSARLMDTYNLADFVSYENWRKE